MTKQLVVYDTTLHQLEGLDPGNATGIGLPAFQVGNVLPAAGQVVGEGYMVGPTKSAYLWDGTRWLPIVPAALISYPTDAALLADTAQQPGSYGTSQMTGNLFISMAGGAWHQVGVRSYATEAAMKVDINAIEGDTAWTQDTNQLWYFNAGKWFTLGVHYYATEAALIADMAGNAGGSVACAMDTGLLFSCPTQLPGVWQPMSIAQFPDEAHMRAKTMDNVLHQVAITQDTNRIYVWTGTRWMGSPVEYFATEAALLAAPADAGTFGIAGDTAKAYVRTATTWNPLAGQTMTAGTALPTTGMVTGDMFYNLTTKTLYVRGSTTWDAVSGGATVAATAPATPNPGQLWFDTTAGVLKTWSGTAWLVSKGGCTVGATAPTAPAAGDMWFDTTKAELKVWRGTLWAAAYQQIENVGDGSFKITSDSTGLAQLELHNPSSGRHAGIATRSGAGPEFWLQDAPGSTAHRNFMEVAADGVVTFPHTAIPRVVGKMDVDHHMYNAAAWEQSAHTITAIENYVPVGHLFRIEVDLLGIKYHAGKIYIRTKWAGVGADGEHRIEGGAENQNSIGTTRTYTGICAAGNIQFFILSYGEGGGNGDRRVYGKLTITDLGSPASIRDIT